LTSASGRATGWRVRGSQGRDCYWESLVQGVARGDEEAGTALYDGLAPIRRYFSVRLATEDSEDRFHDVLLAVLRAVHRGGLRDPERILKYAWSTAKRIRNMRLGAVIAERECSSNEDSESVPDASPDPESAAIRHENKEITVEVLAEMPQRHREVLVRYYLLAQTRGTIQTEMGLTPNQFRLIKSKAKAALTARLRHRLHDRGES
jgi:RNA polymerase sigma factor (sigma-70 family)